MSFRFIHSFYFILVLILVNSITPAQASFEQEFYPFLAEAIVDEVNIRAGQSSNFEKLYQLKKGEKVVVLERNYSWYRVELPEQAQAYASSKYIQRIKDQIGGVTADKVNVRSGPDITYSIIGQLIDGEEVWILEDLEKWYRIRPTKSLQGWVSDEYLGFISKDVAGFKAENQKKEEDAYAAVVPLVKEDAIQDNSSSFEVVGKIKKKKDALTLQEYYLLEVDKEPKYRILGVPHLLNSFRNYDVSIKAYEVIDGVEGALPALQITRLELVL